MEVKYFVLLFVGFALLAEAFGGNIIKRRTNDDEYEEQTTTTSPGNEICAKSTPCGWAVYKKFTRVVDYYMSNKCDCPEGKRCLRIDDDISVSAFVYRCVEPKQSSR